MALWHHIFSYIASKMAMVVPHHLPSTLIFPEQNRNRFTTCCLHLNRISLCYLWPQNQWPDSKIKKFTLQHTDLVRFANHAFIAALTVPKILRSLSALKTSGLENLSQHAARIQLIHFLAVWSCLMQYRDNKVISLWSAGSQVGTMDKTD